MEELIKDVPTTGEGLNVEQVFNRVRDRGEKFTKIEANYREPTEIEESCGTCRFFLRDEFSERGRCQVVTGSVAWFGVSDLYISAEDEAEASLDMENIYTGEDERKEIDDMGKKRQEKKARQKAQALKNEEALEELDNDQAILEEALAHPDEIDEEEEGVIEKPDLDNVVEALQLEENSDDDEEEKGSGNSSETLTVIKSILIKEKFGENSEGKFDAELAEVHSVLHTLSAGDLINDVLYRAKLSTASRNDLPDSAFACIQPGGKKDDSGRTTPRSLRRLPINDKARVRNALARIPQMLKRGGESATTARCGRTKVLTAARKMGIGQPAKKSESGIQVFKDNQDNWRWIGWVSNNFIDREGDIISKEAHEEYVDFLNQNPRFAPEFRVWHTPGTARKDKADWWSYTNGFLLMSGQLTLKEAEVLLVAGNKHAIGMSHGFFVLDKDPNDPRVITRYRSFEVSDLPREHAANIWTSLEAIEKENNMADKDVNRQEYLEGIVGTDFVELLNASTEEASTTLDEAGVENKSLEDKEDKQPESGEQAQLVALLEYVSKGLGFQELSDWVEEANGKFDQVFKLLEALPGLEEALKEVKKSDDEKIAETFIPPIAARFAWKQASKSDDTVLDETKSEDAELLKEGLQETSASWFGNQHEVEPVIDTIQS